MRTELQRAEREMSGSPVRGVIFVAGDSAISEKLRRSDIFHSAPTELPVFFFGESTKIPLLTELKEIPL